jgi:hypothetical protein
MEDGIRRSYGLRVRVGLALARGLLGVGVLLAIKISVNVMPFLFASET